MEVWKLHSMATLVIPWLSNGNIKLSDRDGFSIGRRLLPKWRSTNKALRKVFFQIWTWDIESPYFASLVCLLFIWGCKSIQKPFLWMENLFPSVKHISSSTNSPIHIDTHESVNLLELNCLLTWHHPTAINSGQLHVT